MHAAVVTCKFRESVLPRRPMAYRRAFPLTRFPLNRCATTPLPSAIFSTLFTCERERERKEEEEKQPSRGKTKVFVPSHPCTSFVRCFFVFTIDSTTSPRCRTCRPTSAEAAAGAGASGHQQHVYRGISCVIFRTIFARISSMGHAYEGVFTSAKSRGNSLPKK